MFVLLFTGVVTGVVLRLGYPTAIKLYDEAVPCQVTVDVPAYTSKLRFLVDLSLPGVQSAVIYAKPGMSVERSAENRISADQFGDVDVTVPNPKPGTWTIGYYGDCTCPILFDGFTPTVSVTLHTELNDPIVDLVEQNRFTAYVNVRQGRMGFFRFTLTDAAKVFFVLDPIDVSVADELVAYLRKDGAPDLNDLQDPELSAQLALTQSITSGGDKSGEIFLKAGSWTLGVKAKTINRNKLPGQDEPTQFALMYSVDNAPVKQDPPTMDVCSKDKAMAEQGTWDKCRFLNCAECKKTAGCGYCRLAYGAWDYDECQSIDANGLCGGPFALATVKPYNESQICPACQAFNCTECMANLECSWCQLPVPLFGNNTLAIFGCEAGKKCKANVAGVGVKPVTDPQACSLPVNKITIVKVTDGAAPPANGDGVFIPPNMVNDPCIGLQQKCVAQCPNGVRTCACDKAPVIDCVASPGTAATGSSAASSLVVTSSHLLVLVVVIVIAVLLA